MVVGCVSSAPKRTGYNTRKPGPPRAGDVELKERIEASPAAVSMSIGTTTLRYAYVSLRGYYPDGKRANPMTSLENLSCMSRERGSGVYKHLIFSVFFTFILSTEGLLQL